MKRTRIASLVIMLFAFGSALRAQSLPEACGKPDIKFDVKPGSGHSVAPAGDAGKATLVFLETLHKTAGVIGTPTLRLGVDGDWAGAVRGNTFLSIFLAPGEHHLCASWQSHFGSLRKTAEAMPLTVEAGKTYYIEFKINLVSTDSGAATLTELKPVNDDQGRFELQTHTPALWTKKS